MNFDCATETNKRLINIVCPEGWLISWLRWHLRWQKVITQGIFSTLFLFISLTAITNRLACEGCEGAWHDKILITMPSISSSYLVSGVRLVPSVSCDSVIQSNSKPMNNSEYTQLSCKNENTHTASTQNCISRYVLCSFISFRNVTLLVNRY
mgnify:CR=1 FL=1